ncbi:unnamed protein product [[Candida] boidinii]|nr:unnamed protein product [[Candida] boidinii]
MLENQILIYTSSNPSNFANINAPVALQNNNSTSASMNPTLPSGFSATANNQSNSTFNNSASAFNNNVPAFNLSGPGTSQFTNPPLDTGADNHTGTSTFKAQQQSFNPQSYTSSTEIPASKAKNF